MYSHEFDDEFQNDEIMLFDSAEENQEYAKTSKFSLWKENRKKHNIIVILSYIAGCALGAVLFGSVASFPWILLQIVALAFFGALLGLFVYFIVHSFCYVSERKLPRWKKLLIFFIVPLIIVAVLYFRK